MAQYKRMTERQVSFMDNVPVKISEQFKPPRKVGLPAGYEQRLAAETTPEVYDFTLEHTILKKMGEWRKLRKEAEESRNERIRLSSSVKLPDKLSPTKPTEPLPGTSLNNCKPVSPNNVIPSRSIPANIKPHAVNAGVANYNTHNDSILLPIQIAQPTLEAQISHMSHFNFSDFEADTSSPFDNMELKTINDMEVLAHVLQPMSNSPEANKNTNQFPSNETRFRRDTDNQGDPIRHDLSGYRAYETRDNNVPENQPQYKCSPNNIIQESFELYPSQMWPTGDINLEVNKPVNTHSIPIETLNLHNDHSQASYPPNRFIQSQSIPIKHFTQSHIKSMTTDEHYSTQLVSSKVVSLDAPHEDYTSSFPPLYQGPDKSHSKSVPDIVCELEKELQSKAFDRTNDAPVRPNSYGSTGLEDWKPWPNLESPGHLRSCLRKPSPIGVEQNLSILPNPFNELSCAAQQLAKHISEMGFDLPRVARACHALGTDDKKVVEYLLQIQSLEDGELLGDTVERSLIANAFDTTKAVAHLKAMKQLLDLGFKEDLIYDALIRFENDRDKALDYLIS